MIRFKSLTLGFLVVKLTHLLSCHTRTCRTVVFFVTLFCQLTGTAQEAFAWGEPEPIMSYPRGLLDEPPDVVGRFLERNGWVDDVILGQDGDRHMAFLHEKGVLSPNHVGFYMRRSIRSDGAVQGSELVVGVKDYRIVLTHELGHLWIELTSKLHKWPRLPRAVEEVLLMSAQFSNPRRIARHSLGRTPEFDRYLNQNLRILSDQDIISLPAIFARHSKHSDRMLAHLGDYYERRRVTAIQQILVSAPATPRYTYTALATPSEDLFFGYNRVRIADTTSKPMLAAYPSPSASRILGGTFLGMSLVAGAANAYSIIERSPTTAEGVIVSGGDSLTSLGSAGVIPPILGAAQETHYNAQIMAAKKRESIPPSMMSRLHSSHGESLLNSGAAYIDNSGALWSIRGEPIYLSWSAWIAGVQSHCGIDMYNLVTRRNCELRGHRGCCH